MAQKDEDVSGLLAVIYGSIFALGGLLQALQGLFGYPLLVFGVVAAVFYGSLLLGRVFRHGMMTLGWGVVFAAFIWSVRDESFGIMDGGFVLIPLFVLVLSAFAGSAVLFGLSLFRG